MDRPKPTKRQQEQWDELVKDLPVYNPCPKCMQLQSDLRKLVEMLKNRKEATIRSKKLIWKDQYWIADKEVDIYSEIITRVEKLIGGE